MEELYGPDPAGHAAELAHHFSEAATVASPVKLVRYSLPVVERTVNPAPSVGYDFAEVMLSAGAWPGPPQSKKGISLGKRSPL